MTWCQSLLFQELPQVENSIPLRALTNPPLKIAVIGQKENVGIGQVEQLLPIHPIPVMLLKIVGAVGHGCVLCPVIMVCRVEPISECGRLVAIYRLTKASSDPSGPSIW